MRKTKIIATIGPNSVKKETLERLIISGVNVCRLNLSHSDHAWHARAIKKIREISKRYRKNVAIMTDIQGARIRVLNKKPVTLERNDLVYLTDEHGTYKYHLKRELILDWPGFYLHIKRGDKIFISDGLINLEIIRKTKEGCVAKVIEGGRIIKGKGVNIPAISSHMGFLTEKDFEDLKFLLEQNVDFICASFVGKASDVIGLKKIISDFCLKREKELGVKIKNKHLQKGKNKVNPPSVVAKVERRAAIRNLDKIIDESDGIMVARGDLAIEMPQERLGVLQKDIIKKCLKRKKPVIVATQMAASMLEKPRPTRAEILDMTNAVIDGADAILFSNETTVGKFPIEVIEIAEKVIEETEKSSYNDVNLKKNNRLTRMLFPKKSKAKRKKTVRVKSIENCLAISSLRQENIIVKYETHKSNMKKKAALIWGAE